MKKSVSSRSILAVLVLLAAACTTSPSAGPPVTEHTWSSYVSPVYPVILEESHTMPAGGKARTWLLQKPLDQLPGEQLPVVFVLHGHGSTSHAMTDYVGDRVSSRRFIAVYPQGWGQTWNVGGCCLPASEAWIDDLGFLDAILDYLATRPDVDPDQISISGGSLGGILSYEYACTRADRLAGLVSVSGTKIAPCLPNATIPTMQIHSLADEAVAYDGGFTSTEWLLGLNFPAVVPTMQTWAASNGECPEGPSETEQTVTPIASATIWDCGGTITRLETLSTGGHGWPVIGDYIVADHLLDFLLGPDLCAPGFFSATGEEPCVPAPAGTFVDTEGATEAIACDLGSYQDEEGQTSCKNALPGTFVDVEGSASATFCPLGGFQPNAGANECLLAPIGTYVDSVGAIAATDCPAGMTTTAAGSTSLSDCLAAPILEVAYSNMDSA